MVYKWSQFFLLLIVDAPFPQEQQLKPDKIEKQARYYIRTDVKYAYLHTDEYFQIAER